MPYRTIADLPKAQTDQYNQHQKKAFLEAFNSAYEKYKDDESHAFAAGVLERVAAGALERRLGLRVGLQVELVVAEQGHKQAIDVKAMPAEHAA